MKNEQVNEFHRHRTLKELLIFGAQTYPDDPAFLYKEKKEEIVVSYRQFKNDVDGLGTWFYQNGYKNCKIAVFGENSYPWIVTYFSAVCGKNVIVPIDKDLSPEGIAELLADSESRFMMYSDQYEDIAQAVNEMTPGNVQLCCMKRIWELISQGRKIIEAGDRSYIEEEIQEDDLASIVYTSGTSGKSKGVMMSHRNFCSNTYGSCDAVDIKSGTALLLLPLHHTFGLVTNVFSAIAYGYPLYINRSLKRLLSDIQKVKPYLLCAVPLMIELMHKKIWETSRKEGKEVTLRRLMKFSDILLKCGIDVRRKLFKSVLDAFGGNLELIVSGGAPIEEKYIRDFRSLGIIVQNGYGITECGPVVSVTRGRFPTIGSVGTPLCCNQIKISDEGEILVKGENVMQGYFHNEEENRNAFDGEWLRTGDLGHIKKGELYITGRIKNLIILSNGENLSAEAIENEIYRKIPYVKEVIAYGENGVIVAEVYLDEETTDAKERIHEDIRALNRQLPQVKTIGKIVVRDTEFPKTSTKKIKRYKEK
ncbi:MAG: AMP-dependent synthetase/ligase [Bariatricus sp.]